MLTHSELRTDRITKSPMIQLLSPRQLLTSKMPRKTSSPNQAIKQCLGPIESMHELVDLIDHPYDRITERAVVFSHLLGQLILNSQSGLMRLPLAHNFHRTRCSI